MSGGVGQQHSLRSPKFFIRQGIRPQHILRLKPKNYKTNARKQQIVVALPAPSAACNPAVQGSTKSSFSSTHHEKTFNLQIGDGEPS
jgi:hypothetical protein